MAEEYEDWPQRHRLAGGLHVQLTEAEANEWEEFARQRAEFGRLMVADAKWRAASVIFPSPGLDYLGCELLRAELGMLHVAAEWYGAVKDRREKETEK